MPGASSIDLSKGERSSEWMTMPVNLRKSQYAALSRLAEELGMSPSRATRRILESFLAELDADRESSR
jgi:hypothetical protein